MTTVSQTEPDATTIEWVDTQDPGKFATREFVAFDSQRNRKVTGAVWVPESDPITDTVIAFGHGASGDRYQAPIPYIVHRLVKQGFLCVSMDGPVHGLREQRGGGRPALGQEFRKSDVVKQMNLDWQVSISEACKEFGFEDEKFGYFGLSMGSIFGIPMLADRIQRKKSVTVATLGLLGTSGAASQFGEGLLDAAGLIKCPILFLMQLEDELFPRDGYLRLFDQFASTSKTIHANPGLHPEIPALEVRQTVEFLSTGLQAK